MKKIGIYKITSPNKKIYIGQSWDIERRWNDYKNLRENCIGRKLYNSLKFHNPINFKFEIIHELPFDVTQNILDLYETFYWEQYKSLKFILLNIRDCDGSKGKHSEETKLKMSKASKGIPKSESHKQSLSISKLNKPTRYWKNKKFSQNHKEKLSKPKKGNTNSLRGKLRPEISEKYKQNFKVIIDNIESEYFLSKTDLRKVLGLSLKTFNKILSGKICKKLQKNIKIWHKEDTVNL